jgi:hypothetical protein
MQHTAALSLINNNPRAYGIYGICSTSRLPLPLYQLYFFFNGLLGPGLDSVLPAARGQRPVTSDTGQRPGPQGPGPGVGIVNSGNARQEPGTRNQDQELRRTPRPPAGAAGWRRRRVSDFRPFLLLVLALTPATPYGRLFKTWL